MARRFPHEDSCWLEVWGTNGYERAAFMWGATGDEVFRCSIARQAEAFARAVRGAPCEGAQAADAVAALTVASWAANALTTTAAPTDRAPATTA